MENAADALKMAAAVIIFIIAIASSFSIFGQAKQTADSIIGIRNKQKYLEAAELDNGILYTSSTSVQSDKIGGITTSGDRIVDMADVLSTIQRYSKEKYGVTIIKNGNAIARYDSNTDNVMRQWYNIVDGRNEDGTIVTANQQKDNYINKIKQNITTQYVENPSINLEKIYAIQVIGNATIKCGAPWYGNEEEIQKRILHDIEGTSYENNNQIYNFPGINQKKLLDTLKNADQIIEVTNEIDQSAYLTVKNESNQDITTNLLQQYEMPTVEIIYIIQ